MGVIRKGVRTPMMRIAICQFQVDPEPQALWMDTPFDQVLKSRRQISDPGRPRGESKGLDSPELRCHTKSLIDGANIMNPHDG